MKLNIIFTVAAILAGSFTASALDIKDLLGRLGASDSSSVSDAISGILGEVLSTNDLTVKQLEGNWKYSAPAVTFLSDNLLEKAGGAATAETIEGKLAPVYKMVKLNLLNFTVDSEANFSLSVGKVKLPGTIVAATDENAIGNFILRFSTLGINRDINAHITKSIDGTMTLTFDVSKLIIIMQQLSKIAKSSTITTAVNAFSNFDGLCAGFELKK